MGDYDHYEPTPDLNCPGCGAAVSGWRGKDGPGELWVWRQGNARPVRMDVDTHAADPATATALPDLFVFTSRCDAGHAVEALGEAVGGLWTTTTLLTAPAPVRLGSNGRWSCPCCGAFELIEEPPGTHLICPVCDWEDDGLQFRDVDYEGGANANCLRAARRDR